MGRVVSRPLRVALTLPGSGGPETAGTDARSAQLRAGDALLARVDDVLVLDLRVLRTLVRVLGARIRHPVVRILGWVVRRHGRRRVVALVVGAMALVACAASGGGLGGPSPQRGTRKPGEPRCLHVQTEVGAAERDRRRP